MSDYIDNYFIVPTNKNESPIQMCYIQEVRNYIEEHTNYDRYNICDKTIWTLYTPQNEVIWYGEENPSGKSN